jgi:uncharacterized membrane protein YgcG
LLSFQVIEIIKKSLAGNSPNLSSGDVYQGLQAGFSRMHESCKNTEDQEEHSSPREQNKPRDLSK